MAQAVGDQAKLRRLKEKEETMEEPTTDEIRPPIYGLMAALAETNEHLTKTNEHLEQIRENTYNASNICERQEPSSDTEQTSSVEKVKVPTDWAERKAHELGRLGVTLASLAKQGHTKLFKETWYQATDFYSQKEILDHYLLNYCR